VAGFNMGLQPLIEVTAINAQVAAKTIGARPDSLHRLFRIESVVSAAV
jgi:hypothetical protein